MDSEASGQTALLCRQIWAFTVYICSAGTFLLGAALTMLFSCNIPKVVSSIFLASGTAMILFLLMPFGEIISSHIN